MTDPGHVGLHTLPDGRALEYWDGGDPEGLPLLVHPGTPATYALDVPHHVLAQEHGVRLISVNRPGYGRSSPSVPSLAAVAEDTSELARSLGCSEYAVAGVSGGGPFAVATAAVDPGAVRVVGVLAGVGPWTLLNEPNPEEAAERALLERVPAEGVDGVRPDYLALAETQLGSMRDLDDEARVDFFFTGFSNPLVSDPSFRQAWMDSLRMTVDGSYGFEGYVDDNLAWGRPWDVDLGAVTATTLLWYGTDDVSCPVRHGEWYAEQVAGAELTVEAGQDHLGVCEGSWPAALEAISAAWDPSHTVGDPWAQPHRP